MMSGKSLNSLVWDVNKTDKKGQFPNLIQILSTVSSYLWWPWEYSMHWALVCDAAVSFQEPGSRSFPERHRMTRSRGDRHSLPGPRGHLWTPATVCDTSHSMRHGTGWPGRRAPCGDRYHVTMGPPSAAAMRLCLGTQTQLQRHLLPGCRCLF